MFTGIITDVGRVLSVSTAGDTRFVIATRYDTPAIALGASIACSGACLTVVDRGRDGAGDLACWFAVEASAETLACTTLGGWRPGTPVNLERALAMGDELGGHLVAGHVDGVAELLSAEPDGDSRRLTVAVPPDLAAYIAAKGSVTLDGVSLTVNRVGDGRFTVNIIPHTQSQTT
ncbi:MAG: riboflavin synthase, partial [Alphaproteobacteria bacterium]